eukprot:7483800-Ditylum_brightwellii.AAC.1
MRVKPLEKEAGAGKKEAKPHPTLKPIEEVIHSPPRVNIPPQRRSPRVRNNEAPIQSPAPMPPQRPHKLSIPTPKQTTPH